MVNRYAIVLSDVNFILRNSNFGVLAAFVAIFGLRKNGYLDAFFRSKFCHQLLIRFSDRYRNFGDLSTFSVIFIRYATSLPYFYFWLFDILSQIACHLRSHPRCISRKIFSHPIATNCRSSGQLMTRR